ncbi:MAG: hypothetical protein ACLQVM_21760 [Terriglobia bacterium]
MLPFLLVELARPGAVALTPQGGVSTMGKQENADLKVGATMPLQSSSPSIDRLRSKAPDTKLPEIASAAQQ